MPDMKDVAAVRRAREDALPVAAALANETYGERQAQTSAAPDNQDGYWDDSTGTYKEFFKLGVSRFGDGSVVK